MFHLWLSCARNTSMWPCFVGTKHGVRSLGEKGVGGVQESRKGFHWFRAMGSPQKLFFLGHSLTKDIHKGFSFTFTCSKAGQGPFSETRGLKFEWSIPSFYPRNRRIMLNPLNRLLYILLNY